MCSYTAYLAWQSWMKYIFIFPLDLPPKYHGKRSFVVRASKTNFLCCAIRSSLKSSASLPLIRAPPDALRFGFYNASEDVRSVHEVQRLQTSHRQYKWELKMSTVEQVYGKAAAMRLRTEKTVLEHYMRLPGLPSAHVGLDTLTGVDEQIEFADFLNDPNDHPENKFCVHEAMEVKLSIF
ncbi:uncharacterized protein CCR75_000496 [Bremia lactucae]|uniref:Proteasome maturation factor UMP1 n=1 Tax=Bremia lactucae TaxID=4779 RepID=A0A976IG22_BRELC|nr:hypothetical protein CCR75_000496 [Bremia lactucae]